MDVTKAKPLPPLYTQIQGNNPLPFEHDIKPMLFSPNSPPRSAELHLSPDDIKSEADAQKPAMSHYPSASDGVPRRGANNRKKQATPPKPVLIDDLPAGWDEAHETFESLERCVYERKDMGLSKEQDEMMVCDCVYDKRGFRQNTFLPLLPLAIVVQARLEEYLLIGILGRRR